LNADEKPYFTLDTSDLDNPVIKFYLPQSQISSASTVTTTMGEEVSIANTSDDINKPNWQFTIPAQAVLGDIICNSIDVAKYEDGEWKANSATVSYNLSGTYSEVMNFTFEVPKTQNIN
jgi:hypothetical protein